MGLSNAASRARNYDLIINANQGGGDKKAGFPYLVGRDWRTSIAFNNTNVVHGHCCTLQTYQTLLFTFPVTQNLPVNISRDGGAIRMR
jgi:hypothetical protein